jgi:hypothetical protein
MSKVALPVSTPVSVPMSVLLVVQVRVPNGEGSVSSVPLENTVPFLVPLMAWMLSVPALCTTNGSLVQLLNERDLTAPPMALVPAVVKGVSVSRCYVDAVHVFAETLNVSVGSSDEPVLRVRWSVTALFCATPPTVSVVAEALGAAARAVRATVAKAARAILIKCFIFVSPLSRLRRKPGTR